MCVPLMISGRLPGHAELRGAVCRCRDQRIELVVAGDSPADFKPKGDKDRSLGTAADTKARTELVFLLPADTHRGREFREQKEQATQPHAVSDAWELGVGRLT
jgi:hypothetical protein